MLRRVLVLLLFAFTLSIQAEELARVVILEFVNKTGSNAYGYLSSSIAGAVDESMKSRFEYIRIEPESAQKKANTILIGGTLNERNAARIAGDTGSDIVISGAISKDEGGAEIEITTTIYLATAKKVIELDKIHNKIDSTIFKATDKVAGAIVEKITDLARRQEEPEEVNSRKKIRLSKTFEPSWFDKTAEATFYISAFKDTKSNLGKGGLLGAAYRKHFSSLQWLHWGIGGSLFGGNNEDIQISGVDSLGSTFSGTGNIDYGGIILEGLLGIEWVLGDRLKFFYEVGPGWHGAFQVLSSSTGSFTGTTDTFGGLSITNKIGGALLVFNQVAVEAYGTIIYFGSAGQNLLTGGGVAITFTD